MNIGILTFYTKEYQEVADLNIPERDKYCAKHGYQHIVKIGPYKNLPYYAYDRLEFLRDYFLTHKELDIIFVLNIQSIIMNHNIKIEDVIDNDYDCWITKDINFINFGSSIFRNCDWSIEWLNFLISLEPVYRSDCWREQRAFIHHWDKPKWCHHINLLPQNKINSYDYTLYQWSVKTSGHYKNGDFILSLPGTDLKQRLDIIKSDKIQNNIIY